MLAKEITFCRASFWICCKLWEWLAVSINRAMVHWLALV